jgi:hypothetical protein
MEPPWKRIFAEVFFVQITSLVYGHAVPGIEEHFYLLPLLLIALAGQSTSRRSIPRAALDLCGLTTFSWASDCDRLDGFFVLWM